MPLFVESPQTPAVCDKNAKPIGKPSRNVFSEKTLAFYIKPLLSKWLRTFKSPRVLLVSAYPLTLAVWRKTLKTPTVHWMPYALEGNPDFHDEKADWELVVLITDMLSEAAVAAFEKRLIPGGALVVVSANQHAHWETWQAFLDDLGFTLHYPVGFHPQGAVAWWPWEASWLLWLGKLVDMLVPFFPGRYETGLRWGRCWAIRSLKRDDRTLLI